MLSTMTNDVKWLGVAENQLAVETSDKQALIKAMSAHFTAKPDARSKINDSLALGDTVAVVEEAFHQQNGQLMSQCAMSLYQLEDGLIASITYYPANPCDK
jgi:ketosteroid isomerase-like protein